MFENGGHIHSPRAGGQGQTSPWGQIFSSQAVSEKKIFEHCERTDAGACSPCEPCEPEGSGELKTCFSPNIIVGGCMFVLYF